MGIIKLTTKFVIAIGILYLGMALLSGEITPIQIVQTVVEMVRTGQQLGKQTIMAILMIAFIGYLFYKG